MKNLSAVMAVLLLAAYACPALAADGGKPAGKLAALIASAGDTEPIVREAAARGLGETKDKDAIPALSKLLEKDTDEAVRLAALGALLMIGDPSALNAYKIALKDQSEQVRQSAAEALSGLWDKEAQKALVDALKNDISPKVRMSAAEALGSPGIMGRLEAHHWNAEDSDDPETVLITALSEDQSYEVRTAAATVLGGFKSGKAVGPLIRALKDDKSATVRAAAAESLGSYDKPEITDALVDSLTFEKDDSVLLNTLKSLKFASDSRVVRPAMTALRSASARVRWQAIDVLEMLKPAEAITEIKAIMDDESESEGVRSKAKEALDVIGTE